MSEYNVRVTVRNNLILKAIKDTGCKSVAEFSRTYGLNNQRLSNVICFREKPINESGSFIPFAKELMEILGACPSDLWTDEQLNLCIKRCSVEKEASLQQLQAVFGRGADPTGLLDSDPFDDVSRKETAMIVRKAMDTLTNREKRILLARNMDEMTLEETAKSEGVTRERIRQIEAKAHRKIRGSRRSAFASVQADYFDMPYEREKEICRVE